MRHCMGLDASGPFFDLRSHGECRQNYKGAIK